jgi:microcystin-dependent protein
VGRNYSATAVDTTLASAVTSTATNVSVAGTVGFPTPPFVIAIIDSPGVQEVCQVTAVAGTTLTVTRGYDGTTAAAHPSGALVRHVASAVDFREAQQHIDATTGVHGVGAGAVVGTTTTQSLTNKNLTSGTNTFPTFITGYLVPTGAGFEWGSTAPAPAGYLMQDGGEYPIATYTALYNFLTSNGTVFPFGANTNGAGVAGSTHFRTPNRKGRVAVGFQSTDTDFNAIGKTGGAKTHTLTTAELPSHSHAHNAHSHNPVAYQTASLAYVGVDSALVELHQNNPANRVYVPTTGPVPAKPLVLENTTTTEQAVGGGNPHNNLQPFIVMNYIIKT